LSCKIVFRAENIRLFFFFYHSQYTLREDVIFGNRPKKFGLKFGEYICWI
jgi:hypothetical protein